MPHWKCPSKDRENSGVVLASKDEVVSFLKHKQKEFMKIFVDLDGVLADFDSEAARLLGRSFTKGDNEIWKTLSDHPNFFRRLPQMPDAIKLWVYLQENFSDIEILTAIPRNGTLPTAAIDKRYWVAQHFGDEAKVNTCFAVEKQRYCTGPDCILIDDNVKNIFQWSQRGGLGVFHVSAKETISCLEWYLRSK